MTKEEKRRREKLDCICVLKLKPINQVLIIELVKFFVFDLVWSDQTLKMLQLLKLLKLLILVDTIYVCI